MTRTPRQASGHHRHRRVEIVHDRVGIRLSHYRVLRYVQKSVKSSETKCACTAYHISIFTSFFCGGRFLMNEDSKDNGKFKQRPPSVNRATNVLKTIFARTRRGGRSHVTNRESDERFEHADHSVITWSTALCRHAIQLWRCVKFVVDFYLGPSERPVKI